MTDNDLFVPASSPEQLGIPSAAIFNFLDRIDREQICMHGFLLLRKGKIAAEGYWAPYSENSLHRMYSVSKSFVSLAIGLMVDEGRIHLNDKVIDYFEDKLPHRVHPYLAQATIRDLLMMASPHSTNSYTRYDRDWAATFFHKEPSHPPGTIFSYDTSATVILNTIVERVSGVPFLTYMRERLLDPIGFSKDAWCVRTPEGTSWGGSGVICRLKDMAKLAYVCMNQGKWKYSQLISEEYIRAATSKQIDNSILGDDGYGYQIWMNKDGGFSFRGMGSQFAYCFPEEDLLFACISDTQGSNRPADTIYQILREEIFDHIEDFPLPDDIESITTLHERLNSLAILPQRGELSSPIATEIDSKWYHLYENPMEISRMRLVLQGDEGVWEYENASGSHQLRFGIGKKVNGLFPQTNYFGERIGTPSGECYMCLASGAWVEPHKLNLLVYITDDYLGTLKISFAFKGNEIAVFMTKVAEWFLDEYEGFAGGLRAEQ